MSNYAKQKQKKTILWLTFNPLLALTKVWTTQPCLQQVHLTWTHDPTENQHFFGGQFCKNSKPQWATNLSLRYVLVGDTLFWQVSIDHNRDVQYQKDAINKGCMSLLTWLIHVPRVWPSSVLELCKKIKLSDRSLGDLMIMILVRLSKLKLLSIFI